MKTLFAILLLTSIPSFAQESSPTEQAAKAARSCFEQLGVQISIGYSQAYHGAKPGSQEERDALDELERFNMERAEFPVFETGCNEGLDGDEKFQCYREGYAAQVKKWLSEYEVQETMDSIPDCVGLY